MQVLLLVGLLFTPGQANDAPKVEANTADALIVRMSNAKAAIKDRWAAEDELLKLPSRDVLLRLLPQIAKGMPKGGIWNSIGTREADARGPVEWQIWYALHRVWRTQLDAMPREDAGKLLADLVTRTAEEKERAHVLHALANHWHASAEAELAKLLRNTGETRETRRAAAFPLILHGDGDYRDVMLQAAAKADHAERIRWFELLYDPRYKKRKGADPRVAILGFQLIQAEKAKNPDYIHSAYFLARKAGQYVGAEFAPSTRDARYVDKNGGVSEHFFVDTVTNALQWWEKNREKYERK